MSKLRTTANACFFAIFIALSAISEAHSASVSPRFETLASHTRMRSSARNNVGARTNSGIVDLVVGSSGSIKVMRGSQQGLGEEHTRKDDHVIPSSGPADTVLQSLISSVIHRRSASSVAPDASSAPTTTTIDGTTDTPIDTPTNADTETLSAPTDVPTEPPTDTPTSAATETSLPPTTTTTADAETDAPTDSPTTTTTRAAPTDTPLDTPTSAGTESSSASATTTTTDAATDAPAGAVTDAPTDTPTSAPTSAPTRLPTPSPTHAPTLSPTASSTAPTMTTTTTDGVTDTPTDTPTSVETEISSATTTTTTAVAATETSSAPTTTTTAAASTDTPTDPPTSATTETSLTPTTTMTTDAVTDTPTDTPTSAETQTPVPTMKPMQVPSHVPTKAPTLRPTSTGGGPLRCANAPEVFKALTALDYTAEITYGTPAEFRGTTLPIDDGFTALVEWCWVGTHVHCECRQKTVKLTSTQASRCNWKTGASCFLEAPGGNTVLRTNTVSQSACESACEAASAQSGCCWFRQRDKLCQYSEGIEQHDDTYTPSETNNINSAICLQAATTHAPTHEPTASSTTATPQTDAPTPTTDAPTDAPTDTPAPSPTSDPATAPESSPTSDPSAVTDLPTPSPTKAQTSANSEGWYNGGGGQSCDTGCASVGLICTEQGLYDHNDEAATTPAGMLGLISQVGGATSGDCTSLTYGTASNVPQWKEGTSVCFRGNAGRPLSQFDCSATLASTKHRLCYCQSTAASPTAPTPSPTAASTNSPSDLPGEGGEVVVETPQPTPSKTVDEPTPSMTSSPTASTATLTVDATSGDLLIHVDHANGYSNGQEIQLDDERASISDILQTSAETSLSEGMLGTGSVIMRLDHAVVVDHVVGTVVQRLDAVDAPVTIPPDVPETMPNYNKSMNNVQVGSSDGDQTDAAVVAAPQGNVKKAGFGAASVLVVAGAGAAVALRYRWRRRSGDDMEPWQSQEEEYGEADADDGTGVIAVDSRSTLI